MLQLVMTISIMAILYWLLATFVFWKNDEGEEEQPDESLPKDKKSKKKSKRRK